MGITKKNSITSKTITSFTQNQRRHLSVAKGSKVVVFGHADADGHLAVEQTRSNLSGDGITRITTVVSQLTRSYSFWERGFKECDFSKFDVAIVVDIAFSFKEPSASLEHVLSVAAVFPNTDFYIIDHHPLERPAKPRPNLELVEVPSPYHCCFGPPSNELMVLAEICDGDERAVADLMSLKSRVRAIGIQRAAADIEGVAGKRLLQLLKRRDWTFFEDLAEEPARNHLTVRGRRHPNSRHSPLLSVATSVL